MLFSLLRRHGDRNSISRSESEIEISASRSNIYIRDLQAEFTQAVCDRFPPAQLTMMHLDSPTFDSTPFNFIVKFSCTFDLCKTLCVTLF